MRDIKNEYVFYGSGYMEHHHVEPLQAGTEHIRIYISLVCVSLFIIVFWVSFLTKFFSICIFFTSGFSPFRFIL